MECDLVYEDLDGFFPFQNMHIDVHINQFSKIVSRALIWNQQGNFNGHFVGLVGSIIYLFIYLFIMIDT
jgi:hypothetical protein